MSNAGAGVNDLLSCVVEVLREATELLHFSLDEGVAELLYGAIDDELVGLSRLKDPLAKRIEGSLGAFARSRPEFDREYGVSFTHGKMGTGAAVVECKVHIFGFAFVVVRVVDGCGDAESSVGPIFDKWYTGVCVARRVIDDILVGAHYYDGRSRGSDTSR